VVKTAKAEAPKGALGPGTYQAKHIILATARARACCRVSSRIRS